MIGSSENPINKKKILIETQKDFNQTRKTSNKIKVVT